LLYRILQAAVAAAATNDITMMYLAHTCSYIDHAQQFVTQHGKNGLHWL